MTIKKQIVPNILKLAQYVGFAVVATFSLQLASLAVANVSSKAQAAAEPGCYFREAATSTTTKKADCPTDPQYIEGGTINPDKCYLSTAGGSGQQTDYLITPCSSINVGTVDYGDPQSSKKSCEAAGGEWDASRSKKCKCPSGYKFNTQGTRLVCVSEGTNDDNNIPTAEGPESDCQVVNEDGEKVNLNENNCGIVGLLNTAFNFVSGGVALAVIVNIIYAGIQYSMAQGDPSATAKSKTRIRNALVAFLMYLSLYAFIQWIIPGGVF